MGNKDPNYVVKLEKAISKKYGQEAIENPRKYWTDEDEARHEEQVKKLSEKEYRISEQNEKVEVNGVLMSKKLLNRELPKRSCPVCKTYSFNMKDDAYMAKFECCFACYIKNIQGAEREKQWHQQRKKTQEKN
jgi:hypothetical protein